jgi:hypothetical protein
MGQKISWRKHDFMFSQLLKKTIDVFAIHLVKFKIQ